MLAKALDYVAGTSWVNPYACWGASQALHGPFGRTGFSFSSQESPSLSDAFSAL